MRNGVISFVPALAVALGSIGFMTASGALAAPGKPVRPAAVTPATAAVSLPISSFYQIVADPAQGYLFISQGSSSINEILVTNLAGQEVGTIDDQDGVMGLALSANGSTLYAALSADHAVTAIDTSTLKQTASYPIPDADTPLDVAVQSGKVWVSYSTANVGTAAIGDIDLSAAQPAFETQAAMGGWYAAPELAADPQDSGVLVAAYGGEEPSPDASYDVSADPVTVSAQSPGNQNCTFENDLAVVPGGAEFILACSLPDAFFRYSTADLSQQGSYAGAADPDAVAIDAAGDVAAAAGGTPAAASDIFVYQQGADTPLNTFNVQGLVPRGLAWAPDGSQLFAVQASGIGTGTVTYSLQVIGDPALQASDLTITGPAAADVTQAVTLTGSLTIGGSAASAGTSITITRTLAGSPATQTFDVTTAADGSFTLQDTPPAVGQYTYTASYAGTATAAPATASQVVSVTALAATLTLSGPATVRVTRSVTLTGALGFAAGTPAAGTPITVTRTAAGSTAAKTFHITTAAGGGFTVTDTPPATGRYTYTASYPGSATAGPATATQSLTVSGNAVSLRVTASGPATTSYESAVRVTARLGSTYRNRDVSIYAQSFGSTARTLIKAGRVNSRGELTVSDKPRHSTTFIAVFAGDSRSAPRTARAAVSVRAKVTESLGGNYGTEKISGVTYHLYHHNGHMDVYTTVYPNKSGECVKFQVAGYYHGTWNAAAATPCAPLSRSSKIVLRVPLSKSEEGVRLRIRTEYVRPGSDISNVNNDSAWQYLMVEN